MRHESLKSLAFDLMHYTERPGMCSLLERSQAELLWALPSVYGLCLQTPEAAQSCQGCLHQALSTPCNTCTIILGDRNLPQEPAI